MRSEHLALVRGWDETRATLRRWNADPWPALGPWTVGSLAVTALLLAATWVIARFTAADPSDYIYPGLSRPATWADFQFVLERNGVVLALHSLACLAGFMAGSSLPEVAKGYKGAVRRLHEQAGPLAIGFVTLATLFSLVTQAYALGRGTADLAATVHRPTAVLLVALMPHALPELFALFLPLAAWTIASRRGRWNDLLAATIATTALAVPLLVCAATVETWVTPHVLHALAR